MKKKQGGILALVIVCALAGVLIIWAVRPQKRDTYNKIPIEEGRFAWGIGVEEIIGILGEPTVTETEDEGTILTYDETFPNALGNCTRLVLGVGENDLTAEGRQLSSGLCYIMLEIEDTTKESILERLTDFYGTLSADGGSTQMEQSLKQANAFYFNESHFCEEWRAKNLPEEVYGQLAEVYEANGEGIVPDEREPLMWISLSGIAEGETYTCNVGLHAEALICLKNINN